MCIATQPTPWAAATSWSDDGHVVDQRGARRRWPPRPPRRGGCRSTPGRAERAPRMTGSTRACSSAGSTGSAPGRVDSPPTSITSAPSATRRRPCAAASAGSRYRPPSENESGVTFTTPITSGSTSGDSRDGADSSVAHARVTVRSRSPLSGPGRTAWPPRGWPRCRGTGPGRPSVTVVVPGLRTPRIDMHRCSASMTTITPFGSSLACERVGDLGREPLLDLRAPGEAVDQPGELREPDDAPSSLGM